MNFSNYKYNCQLTDHPGNGDNTPKAYLQYLFVDDNFEYAQPAGVTPYVKMTNAAQVQFNPGVVAAHEKLSLAFEVPEDGYMYIYVATESAEDIDIFFDDFTVKHLGVDIIQRTDYYPFGSVLTHWDKELEDYRFGYQGEFSEEDEETGWNQFEARMLDSRIGRWLILDPERQDWSSYMSMGNSPLIRHDRDGRRHEYTMDEQGNITLTKFQLFRNADDLFAENGDLIAGGIRKGILSEGLNFLNGFNLVDLTFDELSMDITNSGSAQSFVLQLSTYFEKEISGFQILDSDGKIQLFTLPFSNNTFNSASSTRKFRYGDYGSLIRYSDGNWLFRNFSFRMISWFHTHPGKQGIRWSGSVNPSDNDQEYTNHFRVPGFIFGGKGGLKILYPQK